MVGLRIAATCMILILWLGSNAIVYFARSIALGDAIGAPNFEAKRHDNAFRRTKIDYYRDMAWTGLVAGGLVFLVWR